MLVNRRRRQIGGLLATALAWTITAAALAGDVMPNAKPVAPPTQPPYAVAPYAGYVNHAYTAPAFQWGSFGAERHYPRVQWARRYNGDLVRWSLQRRY